MAIRPDMIDYLRTFVRDDAEANDRVERRLDDTGWDGYVPFLNAVFFLAIDRYFDGRHDPSAIIKFVAEMRGQLDVGGNEIDPVAAEALISSVFDLEGGISVAPDMIGQIQTHAIHKALTEREISDRDLDALLVQAAGIAVT